MKGFDRRTCRRALIYFLALALIFSNDAALTRKVIRIGCPLPITDLNDVTNTDAMQGLATFVMVVHALNLKYRSLNVTIEYAVHDTGVGTFTSGALAGIFLGGAAAFNGKRAHGIIGAGSNSVTGAISNVLKDSDITQISYNSDSSLFSHVIEYPTHSRVSPATSNEATAMADLIFNTFLWKRVVVIYTTDTDGTDALAVFRLRATLLGIEIVGIVSVTPGILATSESDSNLAQTIKGLVSADVRIFVLLMFNSAQAHEVVSVASVYSLFTSDSVIVGNRAVSNIKLWAGDTDPRHDGHQGLARVLSGYIGLVSADKDWMVTSGGSNFLNNLRNFPGTMNILGGVPVCKPDKDNSGTPLWSRVSAVTGLTVCTGMQNYSDLMPDGQNVAATTSDVADATTALVENILLYSKSYHGLPGGDFIIPDVISGLALSNFMRKNYSESQLSGTIRFSTGIPELANYGAGDRTFAVRYGVVRFYNSNGTIEGFELNRVGTWRSELGFELCTNNSLLQSSLTGNCSIFVWNTENGLTPLDRKPPMVQVMPRGYKQALIILASCLLFGTAVIALVLVWYRKTRLLKASQLSMMWLVLASSLYACIRILGASVDVVVCELNYWSGHLAFTGIIALFAKTLRVHLIVNANMKKVRISTTQVLGFTLCLTLIQIIFMVIMTASNRAGLHTRVSINPSTGQYTNINYCQSRALSVDFILYSFEALILLLSAKLCYDTRNVPDAVNEAPAIAKVIFIIVAICCVTFPIVYVVSLAPWVNEFVVGVGYFLSFGALLLFYFGPKAYLLYAGADLNAHFQIVRRDRSTEEMSVERRNRKKVFAAASEDEDMRVQESLKASLAGANINCKAAIIKHFSRVPDNKKDANLIILFLQNMIMKMTVMDTADMSGETTDQSDRVDPPSTRVFEGGMLASVRMDIGKMMSTRRRTNNFYSPDNEIDDEILNS